VSSSQDSHSSSGGEASLSPDGRKTYRSGAAVVIWYVWLVFAAANLADLAVRGHNHTSAVIAAVLVLITGVAYVAVLRPKIVADAQSVLLRNPLRDIRVPWGAVTGVELGDLIRVRCEPEAAGRASGGRSRERVLHGWALQSSRRSRLKAQMRARRRATSWTAHNPGFAKLPEEAQVLAGQSAAVRVADELDKLAVEAHARGARGGEPVITWSWGSAVALACPALLLAAAILIR
jgi:Bacterial PH domain